MRLVTWNLGHRRNGSRCPDRLAAALTALEPDIAILVDRTPGAAYERLLEALEGIGLKHQLTTAADPHDGRVVLASRLEMVPGSLEAAAGEQGSPDVLHAFAPAGSLDVVSLRVRRYGRRPSDREARWDGLLHAASALMHRRAILVGDFEAAPAHDEPGSPRQLRRFISEGWQHALPADGAPHSAAGGDVLCVDHAFLSPPLQRIDSRYALGAAGLRLAGSKDALSEQPPLVVDLQ
jgi:hypothetical protein